MDWGLRFEPAMFGKVAETNPGRTFTPVYRLYANDHSPNLIVSPDLLGVPEGDRLDVDAPSHPDLGVLDTKVTGRFGADEWRNGPPLAAMVQVTAQARIVGASWCQLSCMTLDWPSVGWDEWEWEYDPELGEMLAAAADLFWKRVEADDCPPFDPRSAPTQDALARMWSPEEAQERTVLTSAASAAHRRLLQAKADRKALDDEIAELTAVVQHEMGPAEMAVLEDGTPGFTWKWQESTHLSVADMRRDHPDLYRSCEAAGLVTATKSRTFLTKKPRPRKESRHAA
jgi:predicted phage-related endonuclease